MPRFHLHLYNAVGAVIDETGEEFAHLDEARRRAVEGVRSIVSDEARDGVVDLRGRIEIADAAGLVVAVVHFSDALDLKTEPDT